LPYAFKVPSTGNRGYETEAVRTWILAVRTQIKVRVRQHLSHMGE